MLTLSYRKKELPFVYPFTTAHGLKTVQPTLIVQLGFRGVYGYGEATEIVYYGVRLDDMISVLESKRSAIESYTLIDPERFWHFLHHLIPQQEFLMCALDMAAWDLFAKMRQKKIFELWHESLSTTLQSDYTIGIDTADEMMQKVQANPWPIYKVKLGTANDLQLIQAVRSVTGSKIRIDANAGWTYETAIQLIPQLEKLDVELIEQPLAKYQWEQIKALCDTTDIPIIADEDCVTEKDVLQCCKVYDGINIKLTKCGGLTPALRMIEQCQEEKKLIMMGCMNESMIGTAAMAQFTSQINFLDADGPLLHSKELATGLTYEHGVIQLDTDSHGLGIAVTDF
jgi:L-Ala-D/L-Glu epimerase